jgi:hypothetical protein
MMSISRLIRPCCQHDEVDFNVGNLRAMRFPGSNRRLTPYRKGMPADKLVAGRPVMLPPGCGLVPALRPHNSLLAKQLGESADNYQSIAARQMQKIIPDNPNIFLGRTSHA